jgi:hypothetical protein
MIAALERLRAVQEPQPPPAALNAFGIAGGKGWARLFMSHPPLEDRIAALRAGIWSPPVKHHRPTRGHRHTVPRLPD